MHLIHHEDEKAKDVIIMHVIWHTPLIVKTLGIILGLFVLVKILS